MAGNTDDAAEQRRQLVWTIVCGLPILPALLGVILTMFIMPEGGVMALTAFVGAILFAGLAGYRRSVIMWLICAGMVASGFTILIRGMSGGG